LTTDGNTIQQQVGRRFAIIRAELLNLTQRELAAELTSPDHLIAPARISDSERGKSNLGTEYAELFMLYLKEAHTEIWQTLSLDSELLELLDKLPEIGIAHRENLSPGNHYRGPRSPAIATVKHGKGMVANSSEEFAVSFSDGRMILTTAAYVITVEPRY